MQIPAYQVASATAAGLALQRAIEREDSLDPERVRNALASLDLVTFFGRIKFDEHGQNVSKTVVIEQIQDGKLATVWRQRWPRRLTCTQLPPGRRVRRSRYRRNRRRRPRSSAFHPTDLQ